MIHCREDSSSITATAEALGATVSTSFGENITHLVWSNGSTARLAAAIILGITVVDPSWIEGCNNAGKKVDESCCQVKVVSGILAHDATAAVLAMSITNASSSSSSANYGRSGSSRNGRGASAHDDSGNVLLASDSAEGLQMQVSHNKQIRNRRKSTSPFSAEINSELLSSPFPGRNNHSFDELLREKDINVDRSDGSRFRNIAHQGALKRPVNSNKSTSFSTSSSSVSSSISGAINSGIVGSSVGGSTSSSSSGSHPFIPLPSYREHTTGVMPTAYRKQRRSERICDLDDEVILGMLYVGVFLIAFVLLLCCVNCLAVYCGVVYYIVVHYCVVLCSVLFCPVQYCAELHALVIIISQTHTNRRIIHHLTHTPISNQYTTYYT